MYPDDSFFSGTSIREIFCDHGDLNYQNLIATDNGLFILENEQIVKHYTIVDGLPSNNLTCVIRDTSGKIWVGTRESGVACLEKDKWIIFSVKDGLADNHISCFFLRDNGDIWIGTDDAVSVYTASQTWLKYRIVNKKWNHYPTDLEQDLSGRIWVTLGWISGINVYDPGTDSWEHYGTSTGLATDYFTSASFGSGAMWLGTDAYGVIKYDGINWQVINSSDGLINDHVNVVFCDNLNRVWVGTNNGLSLYSDGKWTGLTTNNSGLPGNRIMTVSQDLSGRIWFGTNNGIGIYSEEERDILFFP